MALVRTEWTEKRERLVTKDPMDPKELMEKLEHRE